MSLTASLAKARWALDIMRREFGEELPSWLGRPQRNAAFYTALSEYYTHRAHYYTYYGEEHYGSRCQGTVDNRAA